MIGKMFLGEMMEVTTIYDGQLLSEITSGCGGSIELFGTSGDNKLVGKNLQNL
jgi:hypothetical protein